MPPSKGLTDFGDKKTVKSLTGDKHVNCRSFSQDGAWSRGAFYRFLASVGRGLETLLLAEVRQHDTNLVRHLRNVVPLSAPTLPKSACTNREKQALLHVCLFEETATVVELHEALEEWICGSEQGIVDSRLHIHRVVNG